MDKMVMIEWVDSGGDGRWLRREDVVKDGGLAVCWSVGWLIHEDEQQMMLALSVNKSGTNDEVQSYLAIPRVAIQKIRQLRVK